MTIALFKKEEVNSEQSKARLQQFHQHLLDSFAAVKQDISQQAQWIDFLYKHHANLHTEHQHHKTTTQDQLAKVSKWITYLHQANKKQQDDMQALEKYIKDAVQQYNEHFNHIYEQLKKVKVQDQDHLRQTMMKQVTFLLEDHKRQTKQLLGRFKEEFDSYAQEKMKEQLTEHKGKLERSVEERMHEKLKTELGALKESMTKEQKEPVVVYQEAPIMQQPSYAPSLLTNPEQKLLTILFNESEPLSYQLIADKTGHSVNTVRVNMNLLKKKGHVEEHTLPSGVKLFSLKNKEKIKKLYNLQVI